MIVIASYNNKFSFFRAFIFIFDDKGVYLAINLN
jgi:hypothetical protein